MWIASLTVAVGGGGGVYIDNDIFHNFIWHCEKVMMEIFLKSYSCFTEATYSNHEIENTCQWGIIINLWQPSSNGICHFLVQ